MTEQWHPFDLAGDDLSAYEVLVPGVPEWLRSPLLSWVHSMISSKRPGQVSPLFEAQAALRLVLYTGTQSRDGWAQHHEIWPNISSLGERDLLRLVDWLLAFRPYGPFRSWLSAPAELENLLTTARSKYRVGDRLGGFGLVERVPEGVRLAVEDTIKTSGTAGVLLARAWAHVHGLVPNDSAAYVDAVKAVEVAALAVVPLPNVTEPTLGKVIARMEKDADWSLPFREHDRAPSPALLVAMIRTLWRGHSDRHGAEDYADVTHEEARAGVVLAASLVDWFTSGAIRRTEQA